MWLFSRDNDIGYNIVTGVIVSMFVVGFGSDVVYCRPESKIRRNRLWLLWTFSLG